VRLAWVIQAGDDLRHAEDAAGDAETTALTSSSPVTAAMPSAAWMPARRSTSRSKPIPAIETPPKVDPSRSKALGSESTTVTT